ncbi:MAG: purine-nucleoside phosphorylase [Bacteroidales bacterium]|jgi:purine-nucleoside phosphorylase|nr:purine-nucleoside phosphorylase [Bacteroidales bacterium]
MFYQQILETADHIKQRTNIQPQIAIICGSGLGNLTDSIINQKVLEYKNIPNFATSSVKGHKGQLVCGTINGREVIAMQGRFHYYEGYTMQQVTFPVRVFKQLGVKLVIVTNASGGINPSFKVGNIIAIKDHINLMPNPLIGSNDDRLGVRFPSLNEVYNKNLREKFINFAAQKNIWVQEGIYLGLTGPSFETPAEYKFFRIAGADCVGMSTVPEVIVAAHAGLSVLGLSIISNIFNEQSPNVSSHEDVLNSVSQTSNTIEMLVKEFIGEL